MRGRRKRKRRGEGGGSILRSKCYLRNSFCPFYSFFVRFLMRRWMLCGWGDGGLRRNCTCEENYGRRGLRMRWRGKRLRRTEEEEGGRRLRKKNTQEDQ